MTEQPIHGHFVSPVKAMACNAMEQEQANTRPGMPGRPGQGITLWPKGDLRRMLVVLVAIDRASDRGGASLLEMVEQTGMDKRTITHQMEAAVAQAGVILQKTGARWRIASWGPMLHRQGVMDCFGAHLKDLPSSHTSTSNLNQGESS